MASELHGQLLAALIAGAEEAQAPVLDLAAVESMDSSGVQLLLALRRSLQDRGQDLVIQGASAAVRDVLGTYRLQALLLTEP
jgi:anti-anti-sigma factor